MGHEESNADKGANLIQLEHPVVSDSVYRKALEYRQFGDEGNSSFMKDVVTRPETTPMRIDGGTETDNDHSLTLGNPSKRALLWPVVLVPGYGGSRLEACWKKEYNEHFSALLNRKVGQIFG